MFIFIQSLVNSKSNELPEFGRPVVKPVKAAHIEDTLSLLLNWLRTPCVVVGLKIIMLFFLYL